MHSNPICVLHRDAFQQMSVGSEILTLFVLIIFIISSLRSTFGVHSISTSTNPMFQGALPIGLCRSFHDLTFSGPPLHPLIKNVATFDTIRMSILGTSILSADLPIQNFLKTVNSVCCTDAAANGIPIMEYDPCYSWVSINRNVHKLSILTLEFIPSLSSP